jgi:hypothetical protein
MKLHCKDNDKANNGAEPGAVADREPHCGRRT